MIARFGRAAGPRWQRMGALLRRQPTIAAGTAVLGVLVLVAVAAPYLLPDPRALSHLRRLRPPSGEFWFGTDNLGRSVFSRTLYGARISLTVGFAVMLVTASFGLSIGLLAGFERKVDNVLMRLLDGVMAIPAVLLAVAFMSLFGSNVQNVVVAISLPEIPRMARLVRGTVLSLREQPYVEAAITNGAGLPRILLVHILPNTVAPVLVQATYVLAAAMILESILSFLGAGTPPDIPSWGNMLAEGRQYLQRAPWTMAFPGAFLAGLVLTVNVMGDALRDRLDPRLSRQLRG
jgi:peptide/nickel transport system permease protein